MIRLPDDSPGGERQGVRYYQAQNLESPQIPEAFAPAPSVIRMGWLPQTLDGSAAGPEEYRDARRWLAAQSAELSREGSGRGE